MLPLDFIPGGTMANIKVLPAHVANQIAAGEVVERPASVVKELIENAIDAGATKIVTHTEDGGRALIRVSDNGPGMGRDDLELSVEPHATSKIGTAGDLDNIHTLGFRGEALPSIAAVSRFSITSRLAESVEGWKIRIDFGRNKRIKPTGCQAGTVVEARDIFMELPARRKFLKGKRSEAAHIAQVIRQFAVCFHEIEFVLKSGSREVFRSKASIKGVGRLLPLFGDEALEHMVRIEGKSLSATVEGMVSLPEETRTSSRALYFFLNRRPVKSRLLWKAFNDAYRGYLVKGTFPMGAVFIEIDPSQVDVNVHPQKQEVKFHRGEDIYRLIYHAVRQALETKRGSLVGKGQISVGKCPPPGAVEGNRYGAVPVDGPGDECRVSEVLPLPWENKTPAGACFFPIADRQPSSFARRPDYQNPEPIPGADHTGIRAIGQLADSYIVAQDGQDLILIDQHAAHEAVIFSRLKRMFEENGELPGQKLMFPLVIERSPSQISGIQRIISVLERLGIVLEIFGDDAILIRSVPDFFDVQGAPEATVSRVLDRLLQDPEGRLPDLLHEILGEMACHAAIKANHRLQQEEMDALIKEVGEEGVTNCPHGRPVIQRITINEITKGFKRT